MTIARRLDALEARHGGTEPLLVLLRIVTPGFLDLFPSGTEPAPPWLPAVDRLPGESWDDFGDRLESMIAHLPAGTVVRAISRDAPD
jgi:hypothetical protein